jgi:hypothetical protein
MKRALFLVAIFLVATLAACSPPFYREDELRGANLEARDETAALLERGKHELDSGRTAAAASTFREVVDRDPFGAEGYLGLARAYEALDRRNESRKAAAFGLKRDARASSTNADLRALLAASYTRDHLYSSALAFAAVSSIEEAARVPEMQVVFGKLADAKKHAETGEV